MQSTICQAGTSPGLFTPEGLVGLIFLVMLAVVAGGGLIAVCARRLIHAVSGLALCCIGIAALYYYLGSPFVAMMQMLIYVGAVCVVIAFAIMFAEPEDLARKHPAAGRLAGPAGFCVAGLTFAALAHIGAKTPWTVFARQGDGSLKAVGIALLTSHGMVFELVSVVLLLAIVGAILLARRGRNR